MSTAHTTTTVLLRLLKDPAEEQVWREFDARFRPLLTGLAMRLGLNGGEAEDVAQETLIEFVRSYREGKYERSRGRLSSWIISIAQHRITHRRAALGRADGRRADSAPVDLSDPERLATMWEEEQRRLILVRAMEVLRQGRTAESTLQAFELFAIRGVPADEVARECGMTVDDVYTAKNRVTGRLREIADELSAAWREEA